MSEHTSTTRHVAGVNYEAALQVPPSATKLSDLMAAYLSEGDAVVPADAYRLLVDGLRGLEAENERLRKLAGAVVSTSTPLMDKTLIARTKAARLALVALRDFLEGGDED